jgi:hypothetical protein
MLDHHPRIAFNGESEYIVAQISDQGAFPETARYRQWLERDRIFQGSRFSVDARLDFVALVNDFLSQKRLRDGKEIVGATVHWHFRRLHSVWPRAKYIYLYRDGRDVAHSVMRMGWAGNVYVAADRWLAAETEWDALRTALHPDRWIELRYENLVADARAELQRVCAFLGVEYSDKMFDYVNTSTYAAPDSRLNHQWKTGMRIADVQRLEAKLGGRLLSRGYELSGHPQIPVAALARRYLYLHSRTRAFLFRLRRYGVALTFQEMLARRFGLDGVHRRAVSRINQIVDANLK